MSRFFLEWLCGTPLVWQFDEKVRNFHCEKRFSQRGNLEAIYFGSSPMRVGNVGPLSRLIPLPVLLRKLRILVFFLHRRSIRLPPVRLRCARAGMLCGVPASFPGM